MLNKLDKDKRNNQTERAILLAAGKVFTRRGFAAARMDEIAKEAGINRALLHYYFRSKEKMFDIIFQEGMREFFDGLVKIIFSDIPLADKIRAIVEHDITMISKNPDLPLFVMQEIGQRPERLIAHAEKAGARPGRLLKVFSKQVNEEIEKGHIRNIDPKQLLINIMSLAIYPFIAKPMIMTMQELDQKGFDKIMNRRKTEVVEFILHALKP